jgi:hypothetical protein|tara:strand:- start:198 stop:764 length:567 start_codon:yes stop_codon:yes gene_type:complete
MPPKKGSKSESDSDSSNEKRLKEIGNTNINIDELSQGLDDLQVNNNHLFGPYGQARIFAPSESNKRGPPTISSLSSNDNMSGVGTPTSMGTPRSMDSNKAYVPKNKKIKKDPFKFNIDMLNTGRKDVLEQKVVGVEPELNLVSPSVSPEHTSQIAFHPGSATKKNRKSKKEKKKSKKGGKTKKSKKKK